MAKSAWPGFFSNPGAGDVSGADSALEAMFPHKLHTRDAFNSLQRKHLHEIRMAVGAAVVEVVLPLAALEGEVDCSLDVA